MRQLYMIIIPILSSQPELMSQTGCGGNGMLMHPNSNNCLTHKYWLFQFGWYQNEHTHTQHMGLCLFLACKKAEHNPSNQYTELHGVKFLCRCVCVQRDYTQFCLKKMILILSNSKLVRCKFLNNIYFKKSSALHPFLAPI